MGTYQLIIQTVVMISLNVFNVVFIWLTVKISSYPAR
jgi:hypothetical protein